MQGVDRSSSGPATADNEPTLGARATESAFVSQTVNHTEPVGVAADELWRVRRVCRRDGNDRVDGTNDLRLVVDGVEERHDVELERDSDRCAAKIRCADQIPD